MTGFIMDTFYTFMVESIENIETGTGVGKGINNEIVNNCVYTTFSIIVQRVVCNNLDIQELNLTDSCININTYLVHQLVISVNL